MTAVLEHVEAQHLIDTPIRTIGSEIDLHHFGRVCGVYQGLISENISRQQGCGDHAQVVRPLWACSGLPEPISLQQQSSTS